MVERIVVLGSGAGAMIAAVTLRSKLPWLQVTLLRSAQPTISDVHSTMPDVAEHLHQYLQIDPPPLFREVQPIPRLGSRLRWGPNANGFNFSFGDGLLKHYSGLSKPLAYYADADPEHLSLQSSLMSVGKAFPRADDNGDLIIGKELGYQFESAALIAFLGVEGSRMGLRIADDLADDLKDCLRITENGDVSVVGKSGTAYPADLVVDATDAPSTLSQLSSSPYVSYRASLPADRIAVIQRTRKTGERILPYTSVETRQAGASVRIECIDRVVEKYLFASAFADDASALAELQGSESEKIRSEVTSLATPGRLQHAWVEHLVALGDAGGVVDPLIGTSLSTLCRGARRLAETLRVTEMDPGPASIRAFNAMEADSRDAVRDLLSVHYRFNSRLDSPFWNKCRQEIDLAGAAELVAFYQEEGPAEWGGQILRLAHPHLNFPADAYYTLLTGMRVPYRKPYRASSDELRVLEAIRATNHTSALKGFGPTKAIEMMRAAAQPAGA